MEHLFKGENAFNYLKHLTGNIGSRLAGTENEHKSAEYIKAKFEEFGLEAWLEEFPIRTYALNESKVTLLADSPREINHEIIGMAQDTPPEGIEGEIIYIENGVEEHITPDIKDKIVMVLLGTKPKDYKYYLKYGAKAVMTIENNLLDNPMRIKMIPEVKDKIGALPTVRIPYMEAHKLLKEGVKRARINIKTKEWDSKSYNVIGEIKGCEKPDEIIVVCGHYDTVVDVTGASDNGGGTVITMELARIFAKQKPKRTIRFIAFGSEEMGLRGSVAYTQNLKKIDKEEKDKDDFDKERDKTILDKHVFCINIDVQGILLGTDKCQCIGEPNVSTSVRLLAKELGYGMTVNDSIMSSDNTALSSEDIPSICICKKWSCFIILTYPR